MTSVSVPEPLPWHESCRTTDYDEAIDVITKVYIPHKLVLSASSLNMRLAWTPLRNIVLGHLSYGAESHLIAPKLETFYHVNLTMRGRTRSTRGPEEIFTDTKTGLIFLPSEPASVFWSTDCLQLAMKIDKTGLETELEKLLSRPIAKPVRFDLGLDMNAPAIQGFLRALHFLRNELQQDGGVGSNPLGLAQLENLVITSLLLGHHSNYSEELHGSERARQCHPRAVATVMRLMEAHPADALSLGDYAKAANVSARALQDGFRRHVGTTPMGYLRDARLRRVHEELQAADPAATTIASVISRWGFMHLGRFSSVYRAKYGELPSETLRRQGR